MGLSPLKHQNKAKEGFPLYKQSLLLQHPTSSNFMPPSTPSNPASTVADNAFIQEITRGLLHSAAAISPKFLYDPLGSHLFTAITLLPEYYPTNTERFIFEHYRKEIADAIGSGGVFIDLGAGNCQKAESFFDVLEPNAYVAIDFSAEYLSEAVQSLQGKYPDIAMHAIAMDFTQALSIPNSVPAAHRTFFYPGSSIGNFLPSEARHLLTEIKRQAGNGGLLIGVDLMKDDSVLMAAYDDPLKITAAFNLNILRSVNTIIGSNFNVAQFKHLVEINHQEDRVELYLEALEDLTVSWPQQVRAFKKGERIHTEYSHKYTIDSIQRLLTQAGFTQMQFFTDPKQYFAVIYAH
jgi:dimethylhistidine N-methyltransferase